MSSWQKAIAASAGRKAASLLYAGRSLFFSCIVQLGFEYLRLKWLYNGLNLELFKVVFRVRLV